MFDMEIYWDDSGTHDESPIAVAACYVADHEQWTHFVRDWKRVGEDEGFDDFHMADFMAPPEKEKHPYCDWDAAKKNRVYSRLTTIINVRARMGFAFGVPMPAFEKYAPLHLKKEVTSDAFTFAVQSMLSLIGDWYARFGHGKAIQYVFEKRPKMGKVNQTWQLIGENSFLAERLGARPNIPDGILFQDPKLFKPLRAADILAWNMFTHMRDVVLQGLPDRPPYIKPYFDMLRRDRPMKLGFMTEEQLKRAFNDLEKREYETGLRPYILPKGIRKALGVKTANPSEYERFLAGLSNK